MADDEKCTEPLVRILASDKGIELVEIHGSKERCRQLRADLMPIIEQLSEIVKRKPGC